MMYVCSAVFSVVAVTNAAKRTVGAGLMSAIGGRKEVSTLNNWQLVSPAVHPARRPSLNCHNDRLCTVHSPLSTTKTLLSMQLYGFQYFL